MTKLKILTVHFLKMLLVESYENRLMCHRVIHKMKMVTFFEERNSLEQRRNSDNG